MTYHFTLIRMAIIIIILKRKVNVSEDVENLKPIYIAGRSVKWCNHSGKQLSSFCAVKNLFIM